MSKKIKCIKNLIVPLICLTIILSGKCLHPVRVIGDSMNPTYSDGDIVSTKSNDITDDTDIKYYDVVVCDLSNTPRFTGVPEYSMIIKRVVGLPGDTIQIMDGNLYRNGEAVKEDFEKMTDSGLAVAKITLSDGEFFVLGDNRNDSGDSRFIGVIKETEIIGIVRFHVF